MLKNFVINSKSLPPQTLGSLVKEEKKEQLV